MKKSSIRSTWTVPIALLFCFPLSFCSPPSPYNPGDPTELDFHILKIIDFAINPLVVPFTNVPIMGRIPVQPINGTPPYTYTFESGSARISAAGLMTAPANPGVITLRITDSRGYFVQQLITVFAGSGNGTFASPLNVATCANPELVKTADLNWDGNWDIVVACRSPDQGIFVYLGNGDGTFQSSVAYGGADDVFFIDLGDFNGDGFLDVAAGFHNQTNPGVGVYIGNGDGTFQAFQGFVNTESQKASGTMIARDFNGDGIDDLIISAQQDTDIYLGTGNTTILSTLTNFNTADATLSGGYGDMDGDGDIDIVLGKVGIPPAGHMRTHLNNGDGTFAAETQILCDAAFGATSGVPMADFTGDGNLDIACVNPSGPRVGIHPGDGAGNFPDHTTITTITTSNNPASGVIADFNGDGNLDVATGELGANTVGLSFGDGNGNLGSYATTDTVTGAQFIAVADFNNDGKMDIVSNTSTTNIVILLGN